MTAARITTIDLTITGGPTMPVHTRSTRQSPSRSHRNGSLEYRLLSGALFAIFLPITVVSRLTHKRPAGGAVDTNKSILDEARESAASTVPFAFMG
jgi:hypothetical protein